LHLLLQFWGFCYPILVCSFKGEELNAGTRGTSNRDIFSAHIVAATRRNGGPQPSLSATSLKAGIAAMWLPHEQNIMINMSCQFLSHVKNWVSVLLQQICTVEGQSRRQ